MENVNTGNTHQPTVFIHKHHAHGNVSFLLAVKRLGMYILVQLEVFGCSKERRIRY